MISFTLWRQLEESSTALCTRCTRNRKLSSVNAKHFWWASELSVLTTWSSFRVLSSFPVPAPYLFYMLALDQVGNIGLIVFLAGCCQRNIMFPISFLFFSPRPQEENPDSVSGRKYLDFLDILLTAKVSWTALQLGAEYLTSFFSIVLKKPKSSTTQAKHARSTRRLKSLQWPRGLGQRWSCF